MPGISIIIPVYNMEKYLHKCVDSILVQTFMDFECILIDDGSTDICPEICDDYALKDCRIVIIHQKNAGVSAARNAGLEIARGEWIGFVDSDDWCDPGMFEFLINNARVNNADISICGARKINESGNAYSVFKKHPDLVMNSNEAILKMFSLTYFEGYSWNKLINRRCFEKDEKKIRFDESIKYMEDNLIFFYLFKNAKVIIYSSTPFYNYLHRVDSVTKTPQKKGITDAALTVFIAFKKMLEEETDTGVRNKLMSAEGNKAVYFCLYHIKNDITAYDDNFQFLKKIVKKTFVL
ncbi:glycosyltransferase family 2 protein [Treponema primitia]|uniref:glycosyltransferase family 2 protein n=1 Tax=Treponema primitia TaxID=88058 RepID=UPI0002554EDA|nr:glycosyltransferase [Treponema primitia]